MNARFILSILLLLHSVHGLLPKPQTTFPIATQRSWFWDRFRRCCFDDPCGRRRICARRRRILTDACNRKYEVSSKCQLLSVTCCEKDQCANGIKKCAKLVLKSKPKNALPKDDIFCHGLKELLGNGRSERCSSTLSISPIDVIKKGTEAKIKKALLDKAPGVPFKFYSGIDSKLVRTSSHKTSPSTLKEMLEKKTDRAVTRADLEFSGCNPSTLAGCTVEIEVAVENQGLASRQALDTTVTSATRQIEKDEDFKNLFGSSSSTSLSSVRLPLSCVRYRSAYFCLQYKLRFIF